MRSPRCTGCGRWVDRAHNGQPREHVAWDGAGWVYTCHPLAPHQRPEPMDVPLPFPTQAGEPASEVRTCQLCDRPEVVVPSGEFEVMCAACLETATPGTPPREVSQQAGGW